MAAREGVCSVSRSSADAGEGRVAAGLATRAPARVRGSRPPGGSSGVPGGTSSRPSHDGDPWAGVTVTSVRGPPANTACRFPAAQRATSWNTPRGSGSSAARPSLARVAVADSSTRGGCLLCRPSRRVGAGGAAPGSRSHRLACLTRSPAPRPAYLADTSRYSGVPRSAVCRRRAPRSRRRLPAGTLAAPAMRQLLGVHAGRLPLERDRLDNRASRGRRVEGSDPLRTVRTRATGPRCPGPCPLAPEPIASSGESPAPGLALVWSGGAWGGVARRGSSRSSRARLSPPDCHLSETAIEGGAWSPPARDSVSPPPVRRPSPPARRGSRALHRPPARHALPHDSFRETQHFRCCGDRSVPRVTRARPIRASRPASASG